MSISELYSIYKNHPNICTDSRKISDKSLFFALKGEHFNGNEFAEKAIKNGCSYAVVDEAKYAQKDNVILVNNVLKTLQELAIFHRAQLSITIIGITGTNGKTTSKELIAAVLSSEKNCYATKGNLNNHIGVPLSILGIRQKDEIAIIEMGANHINEIEFLCTIAQPTHGVITNIGSAHFEGFGDLKGVINAKNELYQFIKKSNGSIFVNNEDELLLELVSEIDKITYGNKGDCSGKLENISPFVSVAFKNKVIQSKLIGDFQFYNILLAICIGKHFGIADDKIKTAIENYTPSNNRSEIIETQYNTLILDAYNANPSSMKAMLTTFAKQGFKKKLCVLGDMLEMGETSLKEHKAIVTLTKKLQLDSIFIGTEFLKVTENAFRNTDEFSKILKGNTVKNKTILLKGSRGIALEKLVALF
jgi:UDP-N-acetylmuramoyl-tripeptide--D-alanyl-D-alanine ligase